MPVPPFPSSCAVYDGATPPPLGVPRIAAVDAQLLQAWQYSATDQPPANGTAVYILFPAFTDIRDIWSIPGADYLQLPAGSVNAMVWLAVQVQDMKKGTPDEYRRVLCLPYGGYTPPLA